MSGKTRLALETIRSQWPEAPFWFPRDDGDIEQLLNSNQEPAPETVILLDDLDRFLSNQSLTLGLLNQWTNSSCIIIATMMHSQFIKHSDRTNEKAPGWDAVNRFKTLTLNPSLSTEELNAVKLTSYANQLPQIESTGLGPLLGCAEAVRTAFATELKEHSWSGALIKAAADWRRIGLGPASREQITLLSLAYKDDAWGTVDWDDAWKQATKFINHTVPLLRQVENDRWEVLDTIADEANWTITSHTLASLKNITLSGQQALRAAVTMLLRNDPSLPTNDMFKLAIEASPNNAIAFGAYALFLQNIRGDMDQAQDMYRRAINADPNDARYLGAYADFLKNVHGDMDQAQDMYQRAINADPNDATILGAYALFLKNVRGDMDQAQDMFQRAINADPNDATILGTYALFLHTERGDMDQAQDMYRRAINADPTNARNLGNYAYFLFTVRHDMDQAQNMYQQAITADPTNANNLGAYALFLQNIRGDMDQAQNMYQQAINVDPNNARNLRTYANFLQNTRGDMDQAEQMYQRAINADPTNATFLSAYASFLRNIRGNMDQAQDMYQRAINADPTDATTLGNYAIFLETIRGNIDQAQHMYQQAITADPHNTNNLGAYALFLQNIHGDMDQAQNMYQRAITAGPTNANNLGNYAQILFAKSDDTEAISLTEKAISLAGDDEKSLQTECHFYLFAHSPNHRKDSGRALKALLADGVTTGDWSFEMNLERLRREEDPRLELLEAVARTLKDGDTSRLDAFEEWRDL